MFEQTRQHYLKQMGVTLWYSRCELPGAAASADFSFGANLEGGVDLENEFVEVSGSVSSSVDAAGPSAGAPKSAADILNALATPSQKPASASGQNNIASSAALVDAPVVNNAASAMLGRPEKTETLPLAVEPLSPLVKDPSFGSIEALELIVWVGEKNWFLSENDSEFPEPLRRELLLNIASALGENTEGTQVLLFKWPFFSNQRLPGNNVESMLALLREWLDGQVKTDYLNGFLMGEKVTELLLQKSALECSGKKLELNISDERGVNVISTLSLNDLLREPLNKRTLWQQLSPYRIK